MIFNPVIQGSTGGGNITTPELVIEQAPGVQSGKFTNYELEIDTPVDYHTFFISISGGQISQLFVNKEMIYSNNLNASIMLTVSFPEPDKIHIFEQAMGGTSPTSEISYVIY